MAFKRKASFSAIVSPITPGTVPGDSPTIDETPKHLNSRTRKRFRDNRPSDEVVYGKYSSPNAIPYCCIDRELTEDTR